MHVFFFSFVRITSYSILSVFPYFYVHIYLPVTVDGYIDRCQASYVVGVVGTITGSLLENVPKCVFKKGVGGKTLSSFVFRGALTCVSGSKLYCVCH